VSTLTLTWRPPGAGCRIRSGVLSLVLALLVTAGSARGEELTLSVAVSMKEAVEQLGKLFQQSHPGVVLRFNFGGSGELEKQIEAGAPVDLFISAAVRQVDELERLGLIDRASRRALARNVLVVIAPADSRLALASAAELAGPHVGRIAVGNPKTVPAGQYAEESLRSLRVWDRLGDKLVFAENVRQVLDYVARGEVDAGIVYATDARVRTDRTIVAFRLPPSSHAAVVYPAAVVAGCRNAALARAFIDLAAGPAGQSVLAGFGFARPGGADR
jgi:molybdate transport system substrate-binding protein